MAKMGRPRKVIDWETVEKLCAIACTGEEIAALAGVSYDTLVLALKREKKTTFTDYYKKHSASGNISLRRAQFKLAVNKLDRGMLIWLGKQRLGQSEPQGPNTNADDIAEALKNLKLPI